MRRRRASDVSNRCRPCTPRSEEHTSELQSHHDLVCRLLLEKKKMPIPSNYPVIRRDAFQTRNRFLASALMMAMPNNYMWLACRVYSGVLATVFSFIQILLFS